MAIPKLGKSKKGQPLHYSVGALIKKGNKYLLVDRKKTPCGFAGIAGHIDEGETNLDALIREVKEEGGLKVEKHELLFEGELDWNLCSKGVNVHYWYLFNCEVSGDINQNPVETKSIGWYSKKDIKKLKLEPVWNYWFEKFGVK